MKPLMKLFKIFGTNVDKQINKYLITHNYEDLKRIDRTDILISVYEAAKEVVEIGEKYDKSKNNNELLRSQYDKFVNNVKNSKDENGSKIAGVDLERAVTKCEIKKKQLEMSDELVSVLTLAKDAKVKKFDDLVSFLVEYDTRLDYSEAVLELNKTKAELSTVINVKPDDSLLENMNAVSKEYEVQFKANNLVEAKLGLGKEPSQAVSLDDRIANL